ncbi:hypothetical protein B7P43_G13737 [Cryptotermes secundus]|uniref:TGF-beta family profile domain-containing protein n=1 Tax=Cryptotermes secundus TaxID=105785 RepID=A0A2J7Q5K7_9NEOP|nr:hypothetical protein B7P43_G13737 [Cryptotermes secundus]
MNYTYNRTSFLSAPQNRFYASGWEQASVLEPERGLKVPNGDWRHLLVFDIPSSNFGEILQYAELRLLLTTVQRQTSTAPSEETGVERLVHIYLLNEQARLLELGVRHVFQRHGDTWLSFNVTAAVRRPEPFTQLRLLVHIRATSPRSQLDLALVVPPHTTRSKRDAEDYEEESNNIWDDDRAPVGTGLQARRTRRQRNTCRRRPLYIDFSEIHYDTWIVAPDGYEAFQCTGKCFFPVSEHLSPTKHAIVQTLLHSVAPGKVSRACCVPTRLEPISVLYIDQKGVLTYRFSYQDMVVAECGCRTVARWEKAFNEGRKKWQTCINQVLLVSVKKNYMLFPRYWRVIRHHTIRELAQETGLAYTTVLHILKECLGMRKIASRWVPHDLMEMQKWLRYNTARNHLECYEREGEAFLCRIITLDKTWAKSYEPQMKRQSYE